MEVGSHLLFHFPSLALRYEVTVTLIVTLC
jgi:hypothetical protein